MSTRIFVVRIMHTFATYTSSVMGVCELVATRILNPRKGDIRNRCLDNKQAQLTGGGDEPVLESATEARSYLFFSLFRSGDMVTVGILRRFIPLRTSN